MRGRTGHCHCHCHALPVHSVVVALPVFAFQQGHHCGFFFVGDAISAITKPIQDIMKQARGTVFAPLKQVTGMVSVPLKQLTGAATKMTGQAADVAKHGEDAVAHTAPVTRLLLVRSHL